MQRGARPAQPRGEDGAGAAGRGGRGGGAARLGLRGRQWGQQCGSLGVGEPGGSSRTATVPGRGWPRSAAIALGSAATVGSAGPAPQRHQVSGGEGEGETRPGSGSQFPGKRNVSVFSSVPVLPNKNHFVT